jgi:phosphoribosylanthranilate isomerase
MESVTVKICGLMQPEDVHFCQKAGVNILGFVTEYPLPVPWNLSKEGAFQLLRHVAANQKTCIVTGGSPEKVIHLAQELKPTLVQLHYRETLKDTIQITEALQRLGIGVIKTIPPDIGDRIHQFGTSDLNAIVKELSVTGIYAVLADSRTPGNASHGSTLLNREFVRGIINASKKPVLLAGGITSRNVQEILQDTHASMIDVMTGVETSPGLKNHDEILHLLRAVGKNPNSLDGTVHCP